MKSFSVYKMPADVMLDLAQKIKQLRKRMKISQTEIAARSGVSLGSVKRFETSGQISLESLLKLALILNRLHDFDRILHPGEDLKRINKLFDSTK